MRRVTFLAALIAALLAVGAAVISPAASDSPASSSAILASTQTLTQSDTDRAAISRLYFAAFDRPADAQGLDYWLGVFQSGSSLDEIASYFVTSTEFVNTYGAVDNEGLVDLIYRNVLRRPADDDGLSYWVGLLEAGHSSGTILNRFAQSPEFQRLTENEELIPAAEFPDRVLMIGDSIFHGISLLNIPIGSAQSTFMTEEGRQVAGLPDLLEEAQRNGDLAIADLVVIHLGTNGWLTEYDTLFDQHVAALAPLPVLVVNTKVDRAWESRANEQIASVTDRHDHVSLVDWNRHVSAHPEWMRADGIHPNRTGLTQLAKLVEARIAATYRS